MKKKSECIIVDGVKSWTRTCNHCRHEVIHRNYGKYSEGVRKNKRCEKCRQNGKNNSFYGKTFKKEQIDKWKKERSGEGNSMYGTLGGMYGKKHSDKTIKKQSIKRKERWKKLGHRKLSSFEKYRNKVTRLTERQPIHTLPNNEKRGKAGIDGAFHLDHIMSVWYGFSNKIRPEEISDISNLQFIPWLENQKKWYK